MDKPYCPSLVAYQRRVTHEVKIGDVGVGGKNPIRIQSMTTVDTMDTDGSIRQVLRMVESGCEIVRITAPSLKEAENLRHIKAGLKKQGCHVPLVADIHFTPNAAELAATIVEKVRINPGNYADKKKFQVIEYTDQSYQDEIERIRERFSPLVKICKANGTAMRVGTNHGSLSDRILSRYGDTPLGMVESALEFLRICEDLDYFDVVLSMKASNTQVMVEAYRLLVQQLEEGNFKAYPLHLGVTEAGEGEDGRIKSAVGIGALLEDGLGDTVRVSLTEDPEFEAPVAKMLVDRYQSRLPHEAIIAPKNTHYSPYQYTKSKSREIGNIGGGNVPRVIADLSHLAQLAIEDLKEIGHFYLPATDKWTMNDLGADFVYLGDHEAPFMLPNGLKSIVNWNTWDKVGDHENCYPLLSVDEFFTVDRNLDTPITFLSLSPKDIDNQLLKHLALFPTLVLILESDNKHRMAALRAGFLKLMDAGLKQPVIVKVSYPAMNTEQMQLYAATDVGGLLIDGFGDGIWLAEQSVSDSQIKSINSKVYNQTAFGVLQAARTRMSKTEYISCPSCGRTLFDLQETTAMIRKRTDHLKGVKIGIMGCIVNGPGEMADADYGYVGSGKDKITLYKGQEVVKRGVPSEKAVDELIEIIKNDGNWIENKVVSET